MILWVIFLVLLYLALNKWGPKDDGRDHNIFIPFDDYTHNDGMDHPHDNHHDNEF